MEQIFPQSIWKVPPLLTPDFRLLICERMSFSCLSHSVCGNLFWQPQEIDVIVKLLSSNVTKRILGQGEEGSATKG